MNKLILALSIICSILTFVGAFYVISSGGSANAGYAVIPMVFTVSLFSLNRKCRK